MTRRYYLKNIRILLTKGFNDEELRNFCLDDLDFRSVYDQSTASTGKTTLISLLIEHAKQKLLLESLLDWTKDRNSARYEEHSPYYYEGSGSDILILSESLDTKPLVEDVRDLYETAYKQRSKMPQTAIEKGLKALRVLDLKYSRGYSDPEGLAHTRGMCNLLIASIYLDRQNNGDLESAQERYGHSQSDFHNWQWKHLESLAYLGLAITRRKLKKFDQAMTACQEAQDSVQHQSIDLDTTTLRNAIRYERLEIQEHLAPELLEDEQLTPPDDTDEETNEKLLPVFKVSTGVGIVTMGETTDLNVLSFENYKKSASKTSEDIVIDLEKRPSARNADYILEIDDDVQADNGLEQGDWLLIRSINNLKALFGRTVVVLEKNNDQVCVSLKTLLRVRDHYFLKSLEENSLSFVILHYESDINKVSGYYSAMHKETIEPRLTYNIQISGVLIQHGHIRREKIADITAPFIWQIPVVNNISAGLGHLIRDRDIEEYIELTDNELNGANFGVRVEGDSMKGFGILSGDIALIHQQKAVTNRDFAAVVIMTPEIKDGAGALKRFYLINEKDDRLRHVLLESGNPASEHLVVMESGVDVEEIKRRYARQRDTGRIPNPIQPYKDAELDIAGKCVGLVRQDALGVTRIFHNMGGDFQAYVK